MKTKKVVGCYWCGAPSNSSDHVPARGFYRRGPDYRPIKVPSCAKHNSELSKLDERYRFNIQAASRSPLAVSLFAGATVRALFKPEATKYRESVFREMQPALLDGNPTLAQRIDSLSTSLFFEKIARGLVFHHTGVCFAGSVRTHCTHFTVPGADPREFYRYVAGFYPELKEGEATEPGVFSYRYAYVQENGNGAFVVVGVFYEDVTFISIGTP